MALLGSFSFQFLPAFAAVFAEEGGDFGMFAIVRTDKTIKWDFPFCSPDVTLTFKSAPLEISNSAIPSVAAMCNGIIPVR